MKKGQAISGLITATILILVITKLSTDSMNPVELFRSDAHWFLKLLVGFFLFGMVMQIIALLSLSKLKDINCGGCNRPLVEYASIYGAPLRCIRCGGWYHKNCFAAKGGTLGEGCKQNGCSSEHNLHSVYQQ
jgi:hypothetical protein